MKGLSSRLVPCLALLFLVAGASAEADDFDAIRAQSSITTSYDFAPLPKNEGAGISIAIITTGVNPEVQKMLGPRLVSENLLTSETGDDQEDIGTHSVSVLAALAPKAKIISIKALDKTGNATYPDIAKAIERATALGAKIIVMGIGDNSGNTDAGVSKAVNAALSAGRIVVASAGNAGGSEINYPANMDGVVAVSATDRDDKVAGYSNYGGKIIYAPGNDVTGLKKDAKLDTLSGTSSAVLVAGAIYAVLWAEKPKASAGDIIAAVQQSAKVIDVNGAPAKRIDGAAALRTLRK